MQKTHGLIAAVLLAIGNSACPSFSTLKTARALDQGDFQFTAAPTFEYFSSPALTFSIPAVEIAARYGVVDGFDLGLKLGTVGAVDLESTVQLLRGGFDLALAPSVGYATPEGNVFPISLPLLAGVNFGEGHQFVFGPKLYGIYFRGLGYIPVCGGCDQTSSGPAPLTGFAMAAGAVLGVSVNVGAVRVMPAVDLVAPFFSSTPVPSSFRNYGIPVVAPGSYVVQLGIAVSAGGNGFSKSR